MTTVGSSSSPGGALGSKAGVDSLVRDRRAVAVLDLEGVRLLRFLWPTLDEEASASDCAGSDVDDGLRFRIGLFGSFWDTLRGLGN